MTLGSAGIVVAATLDTKSAEVSCLLEEFERRRLPVILIDCGILGAPGITPTISRGEVAAAAGEDLARLRRDRDRSVALPAMMRGLAKVLERLLAQNLVMGFCGIGGGTNAALAAGAFRALPFGLPKMLVSTMVSGDTVPIVGFKDVVLVHSVVDILGTNTFLRSLLRRAAGMMESLVRDASAPIFGTMPAVAMTTFGSTTEAANRAFEMIAARPLEVLSFHARGLGGMAAEALIRSGQVQAFFDLTTTEVADQIVGGIFSAGPDRLAAAGEMGIPHVVLPGAIDIVNFGPPTTVPSVHSGRKFVVHTPTATLMRTSRRENEEIAIFMAAKLNRAKGPVAVVIPTKGYSAYDREGGAFFDPDADAAFADALAARLAIGIPIETVKAHINDRACMEVATAALLRMLDMAKIKTGDGHGKEICAHGNP